VDLLIYLILLQFAALAVIWFITRPPKEAPRMSKESSSTSAQIILNGVVVREMYWPGANSAETSRLLMEYAQDEGFFKFPYQCQVIKPGR
jgi:hypothetical protein